MWITVLTCLDDLPSPVDSREPPAAMSVLVDLIEVTLFIPQSQSDRGRLRALRSGGHMVQAVRRLAWPSSEVEQAEKPGRYGRQAR
jgi:hypothetical protein